MKKIISFIFVLVTMFTLQSCVSAYGTTQDDIYYSYDDNISTDISIVIRYGTPYYYNGYLSYYFYNGWYYYPYFYNDYWYFRPYRHAFRPGYRPHINYRHSDLMMRHNMHGFDKPNANHRGLPSVSDRRFGQPGRNISPNRHRPEVRQPDANQQRRTVQNNRNNRNIQNRSNMPSRSSSRSGMQGTPTRSSGSGHSGRFGGKR